MSVSMMLAKIAQFAGVEVNLLEGSNLLAALAAMMRNARAAVIADLPARCLGTPAIIQLLGIHCESFVKPADALIKLAPKQKR